MNKNTLKSIWAVVAGVLTIIIATTIVDIVLHVAGVYPPWDKPINDVQSLIASSYQLVIGIAAGWLTAKLAPDRPMRHALMLGYVGTLLGLAGVFATWNAGLGPRWYPVSLVVLALPECWAGGKLYLMRSSARPV